MGCVIRVHHPSITSEEREQRMEKIKQATINYYKEIEKYERQRRNTYGEGLYE
jgi:ribosome recycling factor